MKYFCTFIVASFTMTDEPKYLLISRLEADGTLLELVKGGFCNPCLIRNLEVYRRVDALIKTGSTRMDAVVDVELSFKVCEKTVYNIIRSFK